MADAAYLAACAVKGEVPDSGRVSEMDLTALYQAAERHNLTAVAAMALESAGIRQEPFLQAEGKAIRKAAAFDLERADVLAALEEAGIRYMPLKGCILKDHYPRLGMRQMADIDILIDPERREDVQRIMEGRGYTSELLPYSAHDTYQKPPVFNFEMHRLLFTVLSGEKLYLYFRNIWDRVIKDADNAYGYHLSPEDFYLHMIAHEYKHYSGGGTGLRSLLDTWVYLLHMGESMDRAYLAGELEKLELTDFEKTNRELAQKVFDGGTMTKADEEMLDYILSSGTYGTVIHSADKIIARKGRMGYLLVRAFPPLQVMHAMYPVLDRWPILLPLCWLRRLFNAWKHKRNKVRIQLRAAFRR